MSDNQRINGSYANGNYLNKQALDAYTKQCMALIDEDKVTSL